jgi:hypothetical protein
MEGSISAKPNGAATGVISFSLPLGYSIDATKINTISPLRNSLGVAIANPSSSTTYFAGVVQYNDATSLVVLDSAGGTGNFWTTNSPFTSWASTGNTASLDFSVPIVGWSSSQVMSSDADTRVMAASYYNSVDRAINNSTNLNYDTMVYDTHAAMSSGVFTAPVSGIYRVSVISLASTGSGALEIYKNGSLNQTVSEISSSVRSSGTATVNINAGDTLSVRGSGSVTVASGSSGAYSRISIERLSGPSQIAASESVSALYTGAPPTGTLNGAATIIFGTKVKDSHNAYSSGLYTVPVSGVYDISCTIWFTGTFSLNTSNNISLYIDSVQKYEKQFYAGGAIAHNQLALDVKSVPLLAGQVLKIQAINNATSAGMLSSAIDNFFSITRTGNY